MEFDVEYSGSSDMFTMFLDQDEDFPLFQGLQKSHENSGCVLVEKFNEYEACSTGKERFEGITTLLFN